MNKIKYPSEFILWWETTPLYKESQNKEEKMTPIMFEAFKEITYNGWVAGRLYEKENS